MKPDFKLDAVYQTRDGRNAVLIARRKPGPLYPLIWAVGQSRDKIIGKTWGTDVDGRVATSHTHRDYVMPSSSAGTDPECKHLFGRASATRPGWWVCGNCNKIVPRVGPVLRQGTTL
jgi:hypothetical protein